MTRKARSQILYDGCFAHIFSRSIEKKRIFVSAKDFEFFKSLLLENKVKYNFFIHHYCLMHTHFHLALSIPVLSSFSQGLKTITWKYTRYYNRQNKRRGPLWQSRFKSLVIENEEYLYACGRYIEYNPVQAGLTKDPTNWFYSSSAHYEQGKTDRLIDPYERSVTKKFDIPNEEIFTKGNAIGSDLFVLYQKENVSVP